MSPEKTTAPKRKEEPLLECPECGELAVSTKLTTHTFDYGHGKEAVQITATLPLRVCGHCEFEYYDKEGQDARHEAVCRHLGVMTPTEIRRLREDLGLSRAEFADLTGLGDATVARWERGALIQNTGNDRYLRLLGSHKNVDHLRKALSV